MVTYTGDMCCPECGGYMIEKVGGKPGWIYCSCGYARPSLKELSKGAKKPEIEPLPNKKKRKAG